MSQEKRSQSDNEERPTDQATARLIASGSPRRPIPPGARDRVHAAVHQAWREATHEQQREQRKGSRWHLPLALAASIALAGILVAQFPMGTPTPSPEVARVAVVSGELHGADGEALQVGAGLEAGASLSTDGAGRAALSLADGTSLRLDHGTRLTLTAESRVRLDAGAVYIDTAPAGPAAGITVTTPHATATDLGTQFEVRLADASTLVRVREGRVAIRPQAAVSAAVPHVAPAGKAARVDDGGSVQTSDIAPHDPSWAWSRAVAPAFDTSTGRGLDEFLAWSAREMGLELRYADDTGPVADSVTLSGDVEGMAPGQALEAVMATTTLAYRIQDGRLEIYRP